MNDRARTDFVSAMDAAAQVSVATVQYALQGQSGDIPDAMLYAVTGGKGMRAFLVLESARLSGASSKVAAPVAAAIECLHAYSLVHDDLPCMDDDDLRRGQPTVHVNWDEATAVLVGDALQALAFRLLSQCDAPAKQVVDLCRTLADASGVEGMVGGQALDIAAESMATALTLDQIIALQARKTGALLSWSATAGARMIGADTRALQVYGDALGLAFQIADDILDVEGDAATLGKAVRKDDAAGKATFVSLLGLKGAKDRASGLVQEAIDALSIYKDEADILREAARFVIARTH